ncbi:MAG: PepSY-associated TM helix domain-containing protein [Acidobacteriota bacterium]
MTLGQRLARQPQSLWARKALFQVHLWTGIGVGLYIFAISLSGSAIVFRREIARLAWSAPTVNPTGKILSRDELSTVVKKAYPRFDVAAVTFAKKPDRAAEVLITRGQRRVERAFDPYTGKDLGAIGTDEPKVMIWLVKFHDDLLAGHTGRLYNGVGAILVTVLCATGILIWWPGVTRWWRSLILRRKVGWARFNWDLHSAVGFWMFAFVVMWGISGIYLAFPEPFTNLVDYLQPLDANSRETRTGDEVLAWLARIHFGRAYGTSVKWLWTLLGFVPVTLFVTGAIMWWHRVLKPALRKKERLAAEVGSVQTSVKLEA